MKKVLFVISMLCWYLAAPVYASTISIDGIEDSAWSNADVALSGDADNDAPAGDDSANLLKNALTDDGTALYVEFVTKAAALNGAAAWYDFWVFIDADNNVSTGNDGSEWGLVGADYRIQLGGASGNVWNKALYSWSSGWVSVAGAAVSHGIAGTVLEASVMLTDIGSPSGIVRASFVATIGPDGDFNNEPAAGQLLYTLSGGVTVSIDGMLSDWDGSEVIQADADDNDPCIPDGLDFVEAGIAYDDTNLYVRMNLDAPVLMGSGYKEYRIWIDTDPATTIGYQPYIDTQGCEGDPGCIHWVNFYADYHITIGSFAAETINWTLFMDCNAEDCSQSALEMQLGPHDTEYTVAAGYQAIEYAIPFASIPGFDPDCFELTFTTYDADSLTGGGCVTPGDNLPDYGVTDGIGIVSGCPVLITLDSLDALPGNGRVTVTWSTASEIDNAGFNIYRASAAEGPYEKVNSSLIAAKGSASAGASYEFVDTAVKNRTTYYYKLDDIDLNGTVTQHGPTSATPRLIYGIR